MRISLCLSFAICFLLCNAICFADVNLKVDYKDPGFAIDEYDTHFAFDEYVSNPLPGQDSPLNESFKSPFMGLLRPESSNTTVKRLPAGVGILIESSNNRVEFSDLTSAKNPSDIVSRNAGQMTMLTFVNPDIAGDHTLAQKVATVSSVAIRMGGVDKDEIDVFIYDKENNLIKSFTLPEGKGYARQSTVVINALDRRREVSAIHRICFVQKLPGWYLIGSFGGNNRTDIGFKNLKTNSQILQPFDFKSRSDIKTKIKKPVKKMWKHPKIKTRLKATAQKGPFLKLKDGRLMGYPAANKVNFSDDNGRTWSSPITVYDGPAPGIPAGNPVIVKTKNNVIVMLFLDFSGRTTWEWDSTKREVSPDSKLRVWSIRSFDEGKTWVDRQMVADVQCGALTDIIQTSGGVIICPATVYRTNPTTAIQRVLLSEDDGKTWSYTDIDLGGHGHHDGAMEPTLIERKDGSVMMYIRTNWGYLWEAVSEDDGKTWYIKGPRNISSSSSPATMKRSSTGRIFMVWNREFPEGVSREQWSTVVHGIRGGDFSIVPGSWHRKELSMAYSDDDGKTWSKPIVIAKLIDNDGWLSYPYLFEVEPGKFWLDTWFDHLIINDSFVSVDSCRFEFIEEDIISQ